MKPHTEAVSKGMVSGEGLRAQELCVSSGAPVGENTAGPNFPGPGPAPLQCSQPRLSLPGSSPSLSQSLSLGWETLGSSQYRSFCYNMVSGGSGKTQLAASEHSPILQSDYSNP